MKTSMIPVTFVKRLIGICQTLLRNPARVFPPIKPCAIVIGAQKAGTTALYKYLSCHPDIVVSKVKEIDFFNCDSRYSRGLRFYHSYFPRRTPRNFGKVTFDVTPGYIEGAEKAAERIYSYNPRIRLIVLLRDPISRAHSAWQMYRKYYRKNPEWYFEWVRRCDDTIPRESFVPRPASFGEEFENDILDEIKAIEKGDKIEMPILSLGLYFKFLTHYFNYFPRDQVLIICSENMARDTIAGLKRIESFVGLKPHSWTQYDRTYAVR